MTVCSTCKHANYCEIVAGGYSSQVKSCRDYRKGETTNEEWFCGLSTEEKAKFIFWQHFDVYGKTLYELMVNASKGVSRDKQAEVMIGAVVEWLKEKHDGNMGRNP